MAGSKALTYAEETLRVHATHEEAIALASEASELRQHIVGLRRTKNAQENLYTDAEYEFTSDLRGANTHMSQTAFDKHAKIEVHRDPDLRSRRADLANAASEIERCEANLATLRLRADIAVARLHELGGYFVYLASVKYAGTAPDSWPPDYRPGASAPQR